MTDLLLGQHFEEGARGKHNPHARGGDGEGVAHGGDIHLPVLTDRPIDNLALDLCRGHPLGLHFSQLGLLPHRDTRLLSVEDNPMHLIGEPYVREAHERHRHRGRRIACLATCALLHPGKKGTQRVIDTGGDELGVRRVLVIAVKPLTRLRASTEENFHGHGANDTVMHVSESDSNVRREPSSQAMKPQTAANKLGLYLPATPPEFQENALTHAEFVELQKNPPEWLATLRREGPHPRKVVAQKLGISNTALKNSGLTPPLTTAEIKELLAQQPEWLAKARKDMALKRAEHSAPKEEDK